MVTGGTTRVAKLPVTIITGFLGSGKTTVLNYLVKQPGMQSTAVIINEFGEIGIDHLLVETSTELMVELNNGCICCTIRGDLADKLGSLAMWLDVGRMPPVARVIVETTGLADPAPIMHTLMTEPDLLARYRLDRLVTVVDAIGGASSLARFPEAAKQIAVADLLIISKTDLIDVHSDRTAYADDFLHCLAADYGKQMLRMKGIFQVEGAPDRPAVVQGVQHVFFPVSWLDRWPEGMRQSKFVFITQDLSREVIATRFRGSFRDEGQA
jgi:G3E family GTPase